MSFVPELSVLAGFTLAAFILTITPGPDMTFFMSKTLTQGRKAGLVAIAGTTNGSMIHALLAAVGISALLAASEFAFLILKTVGALYLVYIAYQLLRNGSSFSLEEGQAPSETSRVIWAKAIMINLLNPKVVLFFVTFLPQFVSATDPNATAKLLFLGFFFVFLSIPSCLAIMFSASAVSNFLRSSPRVMRLLDYSFAAIMAAFAVKLLSARSTA
ncbi:amino acid transporter [Pseudovibrio japonicus]|uniref:Amino acid transporter n=1 Tax=Pseudovibrio japonicus TaxID=366534 RepID=A0ABQ3EGN3_9HYPH|nr:LysE family translocator [Pseudovibrio japonicus]GHB36120.1 amino acid transporter [Pseudovibrio japonicus]